MLVTYYVSQGSSWINIGLTPITENYYNCSRQKQIPIFDARCNSELAMGFEESAAVDVKD